ncbi:2-oxoacid:acceptor oxidoreductase family protein [Dethiobacter alkaliphilus]|uniref:2-oxoacid:acceptor oxidoreductase family protein n=1 Tax=Dethiobacter alkaliphilus TaxID=427926 RepID=UPI002226D419|nr:2-oxoacid:acceptor oxidoreductase family protein [Dethiobacter alkaliphilus]MCW3489832.1 2-oxoacid:acceptor oxidoreductase family protein [Dethiobacter alkaliphilus]
MTMRNGITEIRLHGRGGQGVVFAATAIAEAAFLEGKHVQSFGIYGAERRGAPVTAFVRVGSSPEMPRCQIQQPDIVVTFDVNLPWQQMLKGLKPGGRLLVNCDDIDKCRDLCGVGGFDTHLVDASAIAARNGLGAVGIPIINTVMLGAVVRVSGVCALESLQAVLRKKVPRNLPKNLAAAAEGYENVRELDCYAAAL